MPNNTASNAPLEPCGICSNLADQEYATQKWGRGEDDTYLPAAAARLVIVRDLRPYGSRKLQLQRCLECGCQYLYRTCYKYLAKGSNNEECLTHLTQEQAAGYPTSTT